MPNNVFLDEQGIINIELTDHDPKVVKNTRAEIKKIGLELKKRGEPVFLLYDLTKLKKFNLANMPSGLELLHKAKWDKLAAFGGNDDVQKFARLIKKISFVASRLHYAETKEEAVRWLLKK